MGSLQVVGPAAGRRRCWRLARSSSARPEPRSTNPQLAALRAAGIPVTTATALWLAEHGPEGVLGVSGTKGKSTTAALAAHLAARGRAWRSRWRATSACRRWSCSTPSPPRLTVLELSSYQIADLDTGPEAVLMTNLFKEHTEWHGSEEAYRREKLRLLSLPEVRIAVLNAREPLLDGAATDAEVRPLRRPRGLGRGARGREQGRAARCSRPSSCRSPASTTRSTSAEPWPRSRRSASSRRCPQALEGFEPLAHRLQVVGERDGVVWVNDSISTTPESTIAALASFPGRELLLIAGGQDRGQDYAGLGSALARAGATVIGVPSTGGRVVGGGHGRPGYRESRALEAGRSAARPPPSPAIGPRPGAVVLLSPAAPSFDHYRDFEERGERFSELAGVAPAAGSAAGEAAAGGQKNAAAPEGRRRGSCALARG